MGEITKIEWCHHTFNPWRGCTKVSPGCANCYAERQSRRNPGVLGVWGDDGTRVVAAEAAWSEPLKWDRAANEAGERRRVFCASLADVFEDRTDLFMPRLRLFGLIRRTPNLDWLLLTKRPGTWAKVVRDTLDWRLNSGGLNSRDADYWFAADWLNGKPPANVWLGVSVEDQARANERIPALLQIPARVRFVSAP